MKPPPRDMQHHELLDALGERGCPICRRAEEAVEDAIAAILHEQVNDPGFRQEWLESGGFCRPHAWRLVAHHDVLGTAILYRALLADGGRHRQLSARCALCVSEASTERAALEALVQGLEDPLFAAKAAASDGLCDVHYAAALRNNADERRLRRLQKEARDRLVLQLDELIRKQDYRFNREPDLGEGDSWIRAISVTAGIDLKAVPRRRSRKLPPSTRGAPNR